MRIRIALDLCTIYLFVISMLMLVIGDNFTQLFLGLEGVGLASYLLINFGLHGFKPTKQL